VYMPPSSHATAALLLRAQPLIICQGNQYSLSAKLWLALHTGESSFDINARGKGH
jgi:hypothetical protein